MLFLLSVTSSESAQEEKEEKDKTKIFPSLKSSSNATTSVLWLSRAQYLSWHKQWQGDIVRAPLQKQSLAEGPLCARERLETPSLRPAVAPHSFHSSPVNLHGRMCACDPCICSTPAEHAKGQHPRTESVNVKRTWKASLALYTQYRMKNNLESGFA